jgi:hypothetical protein
MTRRRISAWLAGLAVAGATSGCYAEAHTRPAHVTATYVPANIEVYPRYRYEGRVVYLVGDRWYYREGPRWVYYRTEPQVLYRQRMVIHQAPPAPDRRHRRPPRHDHRDDYRDHRDEHREGRREDRRHAPPVRHD